MNPYSELKAAWHTDKIAALRRGEQIVPAQVQIILSDLCNQDCHFCSYRMSSGFSSENFVVIEGGKRNHNPNRMIPYVKAVEILEDCAYLGVRAIQFTGGGEPTVHPRHMELFGLAQSLGMETSLVTNGVILRKGWEPVLSKMAWIRVSIDAGTSDSYAAVRNTTPTSYQRALDNVTAIAERIALDGSACVLGVGFVITRENFHEVFQATSAARATGAQNIRLSAMFSKDYESYYDGIEQEIADQITHAKMLECKYFKVYDLFGDRISDMEQHAPDYSFCGYQQFNIYIGGDQKVYRCCTTSYTDHGEVGDLSKQSLREWFASQQKAKSYDTFDARSCSICQFNGKNRVINQLVDPAPVHVNFV